MTARVCRVSTLLARSPTGIPAGCQPGRRNFWPILAAFKGETSELERMTLRLAAPHSEILQHPHVAVHGVAEDRQVTPIG